MKVFSFLLPLVLLSSCDSMDQAKELNPDLSPDYFPIKGGEVIKFDFRSYDFHNTTGDETLNGVLTFEVLDSRLADPSGNRIHDIREIREGFNKRSYWGNVDGLPEIITDTVVVADTLFYHIRERFDGRVSIPEIGLRLIDAFPTVVDSTDAEISYTFGHQGQGCYRGVRLIRHVGIDAIWTSCVWGRSSRSSFGMFRQ